LNHAVENGVEDLTKVVREAINELVIEAADQRGIPGTDIFNGISRKYLYYHLFMGITPFSLAKFSV
jgi:hypothetical protein